MKHTILAALVFLASASFSTASAGGKKDVKNKKETAVAITTTADTLSYAAGMESTRGLIEYIRDTYSVDTTYMADFVRGFKEAISKAGTPQGNAYVAGMQIAQMVKQQIYPYNQNELRSTNLPVSLAAFNQGFADALSGDNHIFTYKTAVEYKKDILSAGGEKWLAENAKQPGVKVTKSGLQYKVLVKGNGPIPTADDEVELVYEGKLIDGTVFDATSRHGTPTDKFKTGNLIKGWVEALTMMPVGSKWEIYIPADLAYGSRQAGSIPPYSTLIFTLEVKGIVAPESAATK